MRQQSVLETLKPTDLSLYQELINGNRNDLLWAFPESSHWMPRTARRACREVPASPFHQAWWGQVSPCLCFHRAAHDHEGCGWLQLGISEDSVAWCLYGLGRDCIEMRSHCCLGFSPSNRKLGPSLLPVFGCLCGLDNTFSPWTAMPSELFSCFYIHPAHSLSTGNLE